LDEFGRNRPLENAVHNFSLGIGYNNSDSSMTAGPYLGTQPKSVLRSDGARDNAGHEGQRMNLSELVAGLPAKHASVYVFERGTATRHSYTQLAEDVAQAQENLRRWGVGAGCRVGIFAPNSYHWLVYDMAMIEFGAVSVPFTDDFAGKIDCDLLDRYQISLLLISKKSGIVEKQSYMAFLDSDNENVSTIPRPAQQDDDALTLVFSSGSAGGLKGLVVTRTGMEATLGPIVEAMDVRREDRLMLFLPMSNFSQRTLYYTSLWLDCDIVVTDYLQLPAAIKQMQPTVLIAPPIYFQMAYTRFVNLPAAKRAALTVLGTVLSWIPIAGLRRAIAKNLFGEFLQQFGGKMRVLITGMAPIKREVAKFFDLMQMPLCESYGMMESGSLTWRPPHCKKYGSVGKPVRGVTLEFTEEGEVIACRAHTLTKHYFQSSDGENERTFIGPGRVATGDLGWMDSDGYLYLQGRRKELIITSAGHKIHPEIVERELAGCPEVAQAAVFLKRGAAFLTCVAALNPPDGEEARARVRDFVRGMISTKNAPIGEVLFADAPFSTVNGMLRPNLKLDRRSIAAKFGLS
jgi:long-chain acyl-CoA synthetase